MTPASQFFMHTHPISFTDLPPWSKSAVAKSTGSMTISGYASLVVLTNFLKADRPATSSLPPPHMTSYTHNTHKSEFVEYQCRVPKPRASDVHCLRQTLVHLHTSWLFNTSYLSTFRHLVYNIWRTDRIRNFCVALRPKKEILFAFAHHRLRSPVLLHGRIVSFQVS